MSASKGRTTLIGAIILSVLNACAASSPNTSQVPLVNRPAIGGGASRQIRPNTASSDYTYVESALGSPAVAMCPSGDKVLSGGFSNGSGATMVESRPTTGHDGWKSVAANNAEITSFAVCVPTGFVATEYVSATFNNEFGNVAYCNSSGYYVSGGGFTLTSMKSGPVYYNAPYEAPSGAFGWGVETTLGSGPPMDSGTAWGICTPVKYHYESSYFGRGYTDAYADCPTGEIVVGGGFQGTSPSSQNGVVTLSRPTTDNQKWHAGITSSSNEANIIAWAACTKDAGSDGG